MQLSSISLAITRLGVGRTVSAVSATQAWDATQKGSKLILSNTDRTVTFSGVSAYSTVRGAVALTGKKYWELVIIHGGVAGYNPPYIMAGIQPAEGSLSSGVGGTTNDGIGYHSKDGDLYARGVQSILNWPRGFITDVLIYAYDSSNGKLWFGRNGVWFVGDPGAGTGWASSLGGTLYPAVSLYSNGAQITANFAAADLVYTPPAGFSGF